MKVGGGGGVSVWTFSSPPVLTQDEYRVLGLIPVGVLLIETNNKLSGRIWCMTHCWFSPSFPNRKQQLWMSAYSTVSMAAMLLPLLLAPALGRKSPSQKWTITATTPYHSPPLFLIYANCHHCWSVCPVNTDKGWPGCVLTVARLLPLIRAHEAKPRNRTVPVCAGGLNQIKCPLW